MYFWLGGTQIKVVLFAKSLLRDFHYFPLTIYVVLRKYVDISFLVILNLQQFFEMMLISWAILYKVTYWIYFDGVWYVFIFCHTLVHFVNVHFFPITKNYMSRCHRTIVVCPIPEAQKCQGWMPLGPVPTLTS